MSGAKYTKIITFAKSDRSPRNTSQLREGCCTPPKALLFLSAGRLGTSLQDPGLSNSRWTVSSCQWQIGYTGSVQRPIQKGYLYVGLLYWRLWSWRLHYSVPIPPSEYRPLILFCRKERVHEISAIPKPAKTEENILIRIIRLVTYKQRLQESASWSKQLLTIVVSWEQIRSSKLWPLHFGIELC